MLFKKNSFILLIYFLADFSTDQDEIWYVVDVHWAEDPDTTFDWDLLKLRTTQ